MLLGLTAIGIHIGVIIAGGRAAALCMRLASVDRRSPDRIEAQADDTKRIAELRNVDFGSYVTHCERLQLFGAIILLTSFLFLSFSMFTHWALPWILLAGSAGGGCFVFIWFWRVSVTRENANVAWSKIKGWIQVSKKRR